MRPPRGRGGGFGGRGGRDGGGRFGGGGRFAGRGGGRGGYNDGPPDSVVVAGEFLHACEGEAVCKLTNEKVRPPGTNCRRSLGPPSTPVPSSILGYPRSAGRPSCVGGDSSGHAPLYTATNSHILVCRFRISTLQSSWRTRPRSARLKKFLGQSTKR